MSEPFGIAAHATPETTQPAAPAIEVTQGPAFGVEGHPIATAHESASTQTTNTTGAQNPDPQATQNASAPDAARVAENPAATIEATGTTQAAQSAQNTQNPQGDAARAAEQNVGGLMQSPELDAENLPISDFAKVDLGLPEGSFDPALVESFGKIATENKLTPAQAKAVANWQVTQIEAARQANQAEQAKVLKAAWGANVQNNCKSINELCARISQQPGLENFAAEVTRSGAADNAVVLQGLFHISQMLAEDSTGRITGHGATQETALEGLQAIYNGYQHK